jgi:exodeoxyribonuclease V beta subunit
MRREKTKTNVSHLSELIQKKLIEKRSTPEGMLTWIRRQFDRSTAEYSEDFELRLETDDDAVKILTIFTSKGLEFPIVFAPTLFMMQPFPKRKPYVYEWHNTDGDLLVSMHPTKLEKDEEDTEIQREHVRQIYVALTRAVHRTVVVTLNDGVKDGEAKKNETQKYRMRGVLGQILRLPLKVVTDGKKESVVVDIDNTDSRFDRPDKPPAVEVEHADLAPEKKLGADPIQMRDAPPVVPEADTSRGHGSFSSLAKQSHQKKETPPPDSVLPEEKNRDGESGKPAGAEIVHKLEGIFAFPAGAKTGTCWHELFEDLSFSADSKTIQALVEEKLDIHGFLKKQNLAKERIKVTTAMVQEVLDCPLPALANDSFTLRDIANSDRRNEWEFNFSTLPAKSTSELKTVISQYEGYKPFTDALGEWNRPVPGGFLKGFVDLLFRHKGSDDAYQYYIIDWKSNRREGRQEDFDQKGLAGEMSLHRYWLQYLLYSVALHQYLSQAMPSYSYEKNFGGVYYIFLRGVDGQEANGQPNGIYTDRPPVDLLTKLSNLLGDFA